MLRFLILAGLCIAIAWYLAGDSFHFKLLRILYEIRFDREVLGRF